MPTWPMPPGAALTADVVDEEVIDTLTVDVLIPSARVWYGGWDDGDIFLPRSQRSTATVTEEDIFDQQPTGSVIVDRRWGGMGGGVSTKELPSFPQLDKHETTFPSAL